MANNSTEKKVKSTDRLTDKQKRRRKLISYTIFFVGLVALVITLLTTLNKDVAVNIGTYFSSLEGPHLKWFVIVIVLALAYFLIYPIPLMILSHYAKAEATKSEQWLIGNSEHFYNGCTPAAVGGQPFQAYGFTNCGVNAAKSSAIILMNYISILLVSNIYGLISLIYYPQYIEALGQIPGAGYNWQIIGIIGIVGNALNLAFFCVLGFSRRMRKWIIFFTLWICKWKLIGKWLRKFVPKLDRYLRNTQTGAKEVVKNYKSFIISVVTNFFIRGILFAIPFFLILSAGLEVSGENFMLSLLGTAYSNVSVAWVPTPGNIGAGELAISVVIASVAATSFEKGTSLGIIYRIFTFYIFIFMSLLTTIVFEVKISKNLSSKKKPNKIIDDITVLPINEEPSIPRKINNEENEENS